MREVRLEAPGSKCTRGISASPAVMGSSASREEGERPCEQIDDKASGACTYII